MEEGRKKRKKRGGIKGERKRWREKGRDGKIKEGREGRNKERQRGEK